MAHPAQPSVAIVCPNSLAVMGLRQMLAGISALVRVDAFASTSLLLEAGPEKYQHLFVDVSILMADRNFFLQRRQKVIVLTTQAEHDKLLSEFHCLCITGSESQLVRSLLGLMNRGHALHQSTPEATIPRKQPLLSPREVEVLALVVQGLINKEIADKLNISLATVITHRKNITEKLGMRSVSALTIYAVMNGYVDIGKI